MDTDSLSKTDRAISTVSKDTKKTVHTPTAISTAAVSNSMMEDGREGKRREEEVGSLVVHGDRGSAFRWMGPGS